jgi:putative transport protein
VIDLLADNPLLLLFVVAATGWLVGRISIGGFSLGIAAVLFAGIAFGALDPSLQLPEVLWNLGLVLFVYTVGLATGPGFVASFRRRGIAANGGLLAAVGLAAGVAVAAETALSLSAEVAAGVFTGATTNTPALAAALEYLRSHGGGESTAPVVGYSLTYPIGVLLPLLAVFLLLRRGPAAAASAPGDGPTALVSQTVRVDVEGLPSFGDLRARLGGVTFGRVKRGGETMLAAEPLAPLPGDLVSVVGDAAHVQEATAELGHESVHHIELERSDYDVRRILVSSRAVAGRRVDDLDLTSRFGAAVTRVRRGDVDLVPDRDTVIELGDRVRVLAPRGQLPAVSAFFGDSLRRIGEIDVLTLSLGLTAGLLLGLVPLPLPGGGSFELGFAGGPLLVALALGAIGRTGPLVWQLPYTANLTLRQLGTVLFLAGVGVRSGQAFASTVASAQALRIAAAGIVVTAAALGVTIAVGRLLLRSSPQTLAGVIAGTQTQPAVLAYATAQVADDREVNLGYATVYPLAMIAKIVLAQVILAVGS